MSELARELTSEAGSEVPRATLTRLVQIAQREAETFRSKDGRETFATVDDGGRRKTWRLESEGFGDWLAARHVAIHHSPASPDAVGQATKALAQLARHSGPRYATAHRVAKVDDVIYLDLADDDWNVAVCTADGWHIHDPAKESALPIRFVRTDSMLPLPAPTPGGSLADLRRLVNVRDDRDFRLIVGWLLATLNPDIDFPILLLLGEPGSAKTTTARIVRSIVDPSAQDTPALNDREEDLILTAQDAWVLAFDNISHVKSDQSDWLARLSTGTALTRRTLYSNSGVSIFRARRPLILNGIGQIVSKPDLLSRALTINLPPIPANHNKPKSWVLSRFERYHADLLGALLDAASGALAQLPDTFIERLPRMGDFAKWVTAAEQALGWDDGTFMAAYEEVRDEQTATSIESSPIGPLVVEWCRQNVTDERRIPKAQLRTEILATAGERSEHFPTSPAAFGRHMAQILPSVRNLGFDFQDTRATTGDHKNPKAWRITRVDDAAESNRDEQQTLDSFTDDTGAAA